jgi:isocitrate dehydrogenase
MAGGVTPRQVTFIPGDGIGPEVTAAARRILDAAGAAIAWEECEAGAAVFKRGQATGVPEATIESIRRTRVVLKGPLETPVGYGEKSANVTLRKLFEAFGNVRPVRELPSVKTPFSGRGIDLVVVRENVEDLYAGIEHLQTPGVAQALKMVSRKGCEKVVRLAFELAVAEGRRTVHCATKANILKLTEGMLKRTFEEVAKEYPQIEAQHIIVDNSAHQLVRYPESFDVIVTTNMNGDILSDLTSGLIGGLGFAPSANIGNEAAMFEAVHGSAPTIAGKDVANPTAVLMAATMMLRHIDRFDTATAIEHALLVTLEDRVHTGDVEAPGAPVGTRAFADAVIERLGRTSSRWTVREHRPIRLPKLPPGPAYVQATSRRVAGIDLFVETSEPPAAIAERLAPLLAAVGARLQMISNRGVQVWPDSGARPDFVDASTCRIVAAAGDELSDDAILAVLGRVRGEMRWTHVEKLNVFDGVAGFTRAQGQS